MGGNFNSFSDAPVKGMHSMVGSEPHSGGKVAFLTALRSMPHCEPFNASFLASKAVIGS